jgi:hypothetical protein
MARQRPRAQFSWCSRSDRRRRPSIPCGWLWCLLAGEASPPQSPIAIWHGIRNWKRMRTIEARLIKLNSSCPLILLPAPTSIVRAIAGLGTSSPARYSDMFSSELPRHYKSTGREPDAVWSVCLSLGLGGCLSKDRFDDRRAFCHMG